MKLTPVDVTRIRELLRIGLPQKVIADVYKVSQATISRIKNGTLRKS